MLVLTRRRNEKIVFPSLGITVEILHVGGNRVKIGIDAPPEVPAHRHEVSERIEAGNAVEPELPSPATHGRAVGRRRQAIRCQLNSAVLGLNHLHRMLVTSNYNDAEATIFKVFSNLKEVARQVEDVPGASPPSSERPGAFVFEGQGGAGNPFDGCFGSLPQIC